MKTISKNEALDKGLKDKSDKSRGNRNLFPSVVIKVRNARTSFKLSLVTLLFLFSSVAVGPIKAQMVTSNVLQRVFQLKCGDELGSAFTIDVKGRQYLVTARHLVGSVSDKGKVELRREADWFTVPVRVFFPTTKSVDIAVLAPDKVVSPFHRLPTEGNYFLSQDVYFLGFPYGMAIEGKTLNAGFPLPFVKKGIIAAFIDSGAGYQIIFVDGVNNPGFSGGPVVYQFQEDKVMQGANDTLMSVRSNSGLLVAWSIKAALDLIEANPTGAEIKP
jgi:S1-C subfamily serine protease